MNHPGPRPRASAVRLAELIAALSLGVDLGFGQPMEHVLRQCIIALRVAERVGLDDGQRSVVYYTALLVNVGCHADAHEQAKWFGSDIELKARKYDHPPRSIAGAAAALRLVGSGNPPLHRFRVGLEFGLSGYRDVGGMITQHAALARTLAGELGLPDAVQQAVGASYEQWDGRGWPGELRGEAVPIASRLAQLAEYLEVAHGLSSKQIAKRLVISPKTARNHIEHIYTKIGITSRARASLFAMQHGLLPEQGYAGPEEGFAAPEQE